MSSPSAAAGPAPTEDRGAYMVLALLVLCWGSNWPIMKIGLQDISPLWFVVARMAIGAACLFAVLAVSGRLVVPGRGDWPIVLSVGLVQMVLVAILINYGLTLVAAGRSAILAYTTPLYVAPLAILLYRERLGAAKAAGLLLGLAGIAVLFNPFGFDWSDRGVVIGNGLLMVAAMAWAGGILHARGHRWVHSPLQLAPWQMVVALILLVPLALIVDGPVAPNWTASMAAAVLYNGVAATAFGFWAMISVSKRLPAITTSLSMLASPVIGYITAAFWLAEPLAGAEIGGLALIAAGVALVTVADRLRQPN